MNRKCITLAITESCNLNCTYCYQTHKSRRFMEMDVAKRIIEETCHSSGDDDEIEIDLFGGEPFLRPDFVVELCEWTWSAGFSRPLLFFATTNGTKIHGDIQNWIAKNRDYIYLGLSLDGTPDTHNRNRSSSYSDIDIPFFRRTYPTQPVKMTVSPVTVSTLCKDIRHLHDLGFEISSTFAQGVDWKLDTVRSLLIDQLRQLCDYYVWTPSVNPCSMLDMYLPAIVQAAPQEKWCGAGTKMTAYDIDGNAYPCQCFLPSTMPTGREWRSIDFNDARNFNAVGCAQCTIEPVCPSCYGMNLVSWDSLNQRDPNLCEFNKIVAFANSYLKGMLIEKHLLTTTDPLELSDLVAAIKRIQDEVVI